MTTPNNPRDEWMKSLGATYDKKSDLYTIREGLWCTSMQADFFYQQMLESQRRVLIQAYDEKYHISSNQFNEDVIQAESIEGLLMTVDAQLARLNQEKPEAHTHDDFCLNYGKCSE